MNAKAAIGLATGLITIIVALFALDERYLHVVAFDAIASDMQQQQRTDYLELKLEIARERVRYLANKDTLSADEREELEFQRDLVKKLQSKLEAE